ncbi:MAG: DUF2157 domain-containing protein [Casimicrobiaceae bacterium]
MTEATADASVERWVLDKWASDATLAPEAYERALELAGLRPDRARWARFLDRLFAAMGALLLASGVVFFIAYNWDQLDRFAKFALVDAVIVVAAVLGWWRGTQSIAGKAALWVATVAIGALLALIGQTYQTGADNYELFLVWALMALPWTIVSNWAPGWILLLALVNLATGLYFGTVFRPLDLAFGLPSTELWLALWALNAVATVIAEALALRSVEWGATWLVRLAAALAIGAQTLLAFMVIHGTRNASPTLLIVTALTLAGGLALFRYRRLELIILAMGALSVIAIVVDAVGFRLLHGARHDGGLFLLAVLLVVLSAAAAMWLNRLSRRDAGATP